MLAMKFKKPLVEATVFQRTLMKKNSWVSLMLWKRTWKLKVTVSLHTFNQTRSPIWTQSLTCQQHQLGMPQYQIRRKMNWAYLLSPGPHFAVSYTMHHSSTFDSFIFP
nr:hypothetical protein DM860_003705 [Ipomoea batatas]